MSHRNPRAGVTLLETLFGLLVMAMVAALLSVGLGTSARFLNRSADASELVQQALARRDLRVWLERALPAPMPGDNRPILSGAATELTLLAVPPGGVFWPGAATEVSLTGDSPIAQASGLGVEGKTERRATLTLAPEGARLTFRYWGRLAADQPPDWHDHWSVPQTLPDLVRITFEGDSAPPPMIIRPSKAWAQSEMSLSSLVPPALPSRP